METRFLSHIEKTESCWLWTGAKITGKRTTGYGVYWICGKNIVAHRVAYELWVGPISDGLVVRHKCRNKHCVNPEHLETGTQRENSADKIRDGTVPTKLTADQVRDIRNRTTQSQRELAREFEVGQTAIAQIISRKTWKHIT